MFLTVFNLFQLRIFGGFSLNNIAQPAKTPFTKAVGRVKVTRQPRIVG
jgi:hypothetical protein